MNWITKLTWQGEYKTIVLTKGCISQQWVALECTACSAPIAACSRHIHAWPQTVKPE
jgi:hypothetical protein